VDICYVQLRKKLYLIYDFSILLFFGSLAACVLVFITLSNIYLMGTGDVNPYIMRLLAGVC
jgi:hypothetical protein